MSLGSLHARDPQHPWGGVGGAWLGAGATKVNLPGHSTTQPNVTCVN